MVYFITKSFGFLQDYLLQSMLHQLFAFHGSFFQNSHGPAAICEAGREILWFITFKNFFLLASDEI